MYHNEKRGNKTYRKERRERVSQKKKLQPVARIRRSISVRGATTHPQLVLMLERIDIGDNVGMLERLHHGDFTNEVLFVILRRET